MKVRFCMYSKNHREFENVDDVDHDQDYIYIYMENGTQYRVKTAAVRWFEMSYSIGNPVVVYPNN